MSWQQHQEYKRQEEEIRVDFGRDRDRERIPRYFSGGETLRRGYCYKTKVWTDFGRVRVRTEIEQ